MQPHNPNCQVIVIGGGAAGLSMAGSLTKRGIHTTVLERGNCIGDSWRHRYNSLKLHTIRRFSGLPYYPIPSDRPRYLSKDEYASYLVEYAESLQLNISLNENVNLVHAIESSSANPEWEVVSNKCKHRAKVVVVATGQCAEAKIPGGNGLDEYKGIVLHSSQYITGTAYSGKRVLVIGLGNSGAEIATDLVVHGARSVSVSVRRPPAIVSREMFGFIPVQLFGIALMPLGLPRLIDRISAKLRRISIGDLTAYGIGKAAWGPFTDRKPAVIDTGFVKLLKQGRILVQPDIAHFDVGGVTYVDGSKEKVDVIIAATGFRTGLEKIINSPGVLTKTGMPRTGLGSQNPEPGLYFIGFNETVRGQLFEINKESRRLAIEIEHYLS